MTVTLNLKPEVEAGLVARAQASGTTVEAYVLAMVERALLPEAQSGLGPEEHLRGLRNLERATAR